MSGVIMETEDYLAIQRAEIASLNEELARERARRESAERGEELAIASGLQLQRKYNEARKQLQSWADEADQASKQAGAAAGKAGLRIVSGRDDYTLGSVTFSPAHAPAIIQSMAESIVDLLQEVNELKRQLATPEAGRTLKKHCKHKIGRSKK